MNFFMRLSFLALSIILGNGIGTAGCMESNSVERHEGNNSVATVVEANGEGLERPGAKRKRGWDDIPVRCKARLTPVKRMIIEFIGQAVGDEVRLRVLCEIVKQYIKDECAIPSTTQLELVAKSAAFHGLVLAKEGLDKGKQLAAWLTSFYQDRGPALVVSEEQRRAVVVQNLVQGRCRLIQETRRLLFASELDYAQLEELCKELGIPHDDFKKAHDFQGSYEGAS